MVKSITLEKQFLKFNQAMDFEKLPIDETMLVLINERQPEKTFNKILDYCNERLPSMIWQEYAQMNLARDIENATNWLQTWIDTFPGATGIYLGLDTLNMDEGDGTNIEIGLSETCNPGSINSEWIYDCENYGEGHLIRSLFEVKQSFNDEKWTDEERSFAEYMIFLGFSGVVLREALSKIKTSNNFSSVWGFHDGDMFPLINKIGDTITVVTNVNL